MTQETRKPLNWKRLGCSIAYLVLAVLFLLWAIIERDGVFYTDLDRSTWHLHRLIWCAFAILLGFASVAFALRRHEVSPFPAYVTRYPIQLSMLAVGTHGLLHCFDATSGFVFYYLSFSICVYCGFNIDFWDKRVAALLGRS